MKILQKFIWGTKEPQNLKKYWCKVLSSIGWIFNSIFSRVQSETRCCTALFPYPALSPLFPSPGHVPALLPSLPCLCWGCPGWLGFVRSHLSLSGLGGVSFALLQPTASFHLHTAWQRPGPATCTNHGQKQLAIFFLLTCHLPLALAEYAVQSLTPVWGATRTFFLCVCVCRHMQAQGLASSYGSGLAVVAARLHPQHHLFHFSFLPCLSPQHIAC